MKIAANLLRRYVDCPVDSRELRELLDDVGIEVKRIDDNEHGTIFTVELLANRGDHHCYTGIATEIRGRTGAPVTLPPMAELKIGTSPVRLVNETPKCLRYTATLLERTAATASDTLAHDDLLPLLANDIHSISPSVDDTNLSNLEQG